MTTDELNERLDDIMSMGHSRGKAHIKALFLDLIGDDVEIAIADVYGDSHTHNIGHHEIEVVRERNIAAKKLRAELRAKVGDEQ